MTQESNMLPSSDLFDLIHAMSKAEKRHFKIYVARNSKNGGSNYLRLFDAIDKQKEYNEEKLYDKTEKTKYGKRLASTKLFLYRSILKSLRQSHGSKLVKTRLEDMLTEAEVLFNKSLYKQSKKMLIKAKKIANKYEAWDVLYKIIQQEINLTGYLAVSKPLQELKTLQDESGRLADIIRQEMSYTNLLGHANIIQRRYKRPIEPHQEDVMETTMKSPVMINEPIGIGLKSRIAYHQLHSIYHDLHGQDQKAFQTLEEINGIWKEHSKIAEAQREDFVRTTVKLMISGLHSHKQYNYTGLIELLKVLPATVPQEGEKREMLVLILKFGYSLHTNGLKYCATLLTQIQPLLDTAKIDVLTHYQRIYLYHQLAIYYFSIQDFDNAVDRLNKVQDEEKYGFFISFRHFSRLMQLIAYYEQGNQSLLESRLRSMEHYIKTEGNPKELELIVLKYIKDTLRVKNQKEEEKLLASLQKTMRNTLEKYPESPLKNSILSHWLSSKIGAAPLI